MAKPRPYSSKKPPGKPDGRTRKGRLIRDTRAELIAHVGGKPSATQAAMIERAVALKLQLAAMDTKLATRGTFTLDDSRTYLAWTNAFTRLMRHLGLQGKAERPPTVREHVAAHAARGAAP